MRVWGVEVKEMVDTQVYQLVLIVSTVHTYVQLTLLSTIS